MTNTSFIICWCNIVGATSRLSVPHCCCSDTVDIQ